MTDKFKEYVRTHAFCIVLAFIVFVMGVMMLVNKVFPQVPTQHEALGRNAAGDFMFLGDIKFSATDKAGLYINVLTTAQRDALTLGASDVAIIANSDQGRLNFWNGNEWDSNEPNFSTSWSFSTNTTAGDPGSGRMRYDNATPASVTNIYVSDINSEGTDISPVLNALASGDSVTMVQADNSSNNIAGTVGVPVDNTTFWTIPVTVSTSNGVVPSNNKINNVNFQNPTVAVLTPDILTDEQEGYRAAIYDLFPDGLIYVDNGVAPETSVNNTFKLIEAWASNGITHSLFTSDHTDDSIKTSVAGEFFVETVISFDGQSESKYEINIRVFDDSASAWLSTDFFATTETSGNDSDEHQLTAIGKVILDVDDKVGVFVRSPDSSTFKATDAQLYIRKSND